jgi:hypothetical protein
MNPWLETVSVILIILSGVYLGILFSRFRGYYWLSGYFLSLLLIALLVAVRCSQSVAFTPTLAWVAAGRAKFVILAIAAALGVITPMSRLPRKSEKLLTCLLLTVVVVWFSVLPFLSPALVKGRLANLKTTVDADGICFQSTDYTCGPAAAVTALRILGLPADEGEIAILSRTSPVAGTLPWSLCTALNSRYGPYGLKCHYRHFDSIAQLKDAQVTLVVLKDTFLSDHCVAVIDVSEHLVIIADPVSGRKLIPHKQFEKMWRFTGIVLGRQAPQSI